MSHYHNAHYIKGTSLQTKRPLTVIYIILDFDEVNLMVSGQLALPKRIAYRALSSIAYAFNTSHQQSFCINVIRHKSFFCICGEEHLKCHLLRSFTSVCVKIYIYFSIRTYFFYFSQLIFKNTHIILSISHYISFKYYLFINIPPPLSLSLSLSL